MKLSDIELDALTEIINIGTGRAANSLSEITGSRIELSVPRIQVCGTSAFDEIAKTLDLEFATTVQQRFDGDMSGRALLAFPCGNALELARIVGDIQTTDAEMDEELCGVLEEIGNILLNAILGSIANLLDCDFSYTLPQLCQNTTVAKMIRGSSSEAQSSNLVVLVANTSISIASRDISASFLLLFETGNIESLLSALTATVTP